MAIILKSDAQERKFEVSILKSLHRDFQKLREQTVKSGQETIATAIEIGDRLSRIKKIVKHGEWLPWLADCAIDIRDAQKFMRLADAKKSGIDITSCESLRQAYYEVGILVKPEAPQLSDGTGPDARAEATYLRPVQSLVQWFSAHPIADDAPDDALRLFLTHLKPITDIVRRIEERLANENKTRA